MKFINNIEYEVYDYNQAPESYRIAIDASLKAQKTAYAPYSNFYVGAALLLEDGTILTATNQESYVYPSGLCAERVLLYNYQANYIGKKIEVFAVTAMPCGACRQVMKETEERNGANYKVVVYMNNKVTVFDKAADLLPFAFVLE